MALRIPLSPDQTLQTEFHEIERRLHRLEKGIVKVTGASSITNLTTVQAGTGTSPAPVDLTDILARITYLEGVVADLDTGALQDFGGVGSESVHGLVPDPGEDAPPTGLAEHVLKEDGTWGFPFRGLVQVTTQGDGTDERVDNLNVLGSLTVLSDFSAKDIEADVIRSLRGISIEGDSYLLWTDYGGLLLLANDGTELDTVSAVLNVNAALHTMELSAADVECHSLHTHGDIEYGDSFWDDLRFPATGFNPAGSTAPPAVLTTNGLLSFSGTADNIIGGVAQMPHAWKEGTPIHPHIHVAFPTAATANTRWQLEYNVANVNADFTTDTVTYTTLTVITVANANNVARHVLAEFDDIPMTGKTVSACVLWRLSRLAASDGADNDTNDCTLIEFDLHYERDSPGSSSEYTK